MTGLRQDGFLADGAPPVPPLDELSEAVDRFEAAIRQRMLVDLEQDRLRRLGLPVESIGQLDQWTLRELEEAREHMYAVASRAGGAA